MNGSQATRPVRWALGVPYGSAMRFRRWCYRRGLLKSRSVGVPVICVGNLTCGGTGKTPMVAHVVGRLRELGRAPAVLTRGYRAVDGQSDEAELLSRLTDGPVVVNADRVAGARKAVALGADCLVMDDGFQHLRLRRDLDIILVDATAPYGGEACLPGGLLREPRSALRCAGLIVVTRSDKVPAVTLERLDADLRRRSRGVEIVHAVHRPTALIDEAGRSHALSELDGRRVLAFCALGNPDAFFSTLRSAGAELAAEERFPDHADYPPDRVEHLMYCARKARVDYLVTTEKDAVKLPNEPQPIPIRRLAVKIAITHNEPALSAALEAVL